MIERFVELANRHAPELEIRTTAFEGARVLAYLSHDGSTWGIDPAGDINECWNLGATLLEYLKGLEGKFTDDGVPDWTIPVNQFLDSRLSNEWRTLTPESVIRACIDVWEVME